MAFNDLFQLNSVIPKSWTFGKDTGAMCKQWRSMCYCQQGVSGFVCSKSERDQMHTHDIYLLDGNRTPVL